MKKWLFNPFVYLAGMRALLIGLCIMIITVVVALYSHAHLDGAVDVHFGVQTSATYCMIESFTDWASLVICLFILGRIASDSSVRFIDIAGTVALARWPILPIVFLGFIPVPQIDPHASIKNIEDFALTPSLILQGLLVIPLLVWLIALLYNAFSVSTNLKGRKGTWTFIAGLVLAEIISKGILIAIFNK